MLWFTLSMYGFWDSKGFLVQNIRVGKCFFLLFFLHSTILAWITQHWNENFVTDTLNNWLLIEWCWRYWICCNDEMKMKRTKFGIVFFFAFKINLWLVTDSCLYIDIARKNSSSPFFYIFYGKRRCWSQKWTYFAMRTDQSVEHTGQHRIAWMSSIKRTSNRNSSFQFMHSVQELKE